MPSLRDILNNADNDSQPRVASGSPSLPPNLPRSLHFANSFDLPTHHASSSASPSRGDPPKCVASCRPFAPPPRPPQRRDGTCSSASEPPRCSSSHPPLPAAASAIVPGKAVLGCGDRLTRPVTITGRVLWFRRGDLIHTCAQCFKTFTRAEHLRRHLPVHTAPSLACDVSGCGKLFHIKHQLPQDIFTGRNKKRTREV
ncbi:Zinc finger, C2H2-type/integrase, DNA-binding protein [Cordyceps fumosorosea ARSEF 2679]|uniref:Zinc finger, C2H2-type/integrase, DNA-binding protein n=1 Tax=Cordyceps fumosorosea (strain ARSEF 2679) TaxID=1081104 RepID=A0A162MA87_CORFA|nr:Zinc finger, C2H2-type/integrase, DNA-binding protein [Cordyceps fumosorosea ARSEF 2679]OAA53260.1 Zinc finger, C2H2-type/integrase, DNA-binding protein [Cordyceps fumosorosea ARSEF 2679]